MNAKLSAHAGNYLSKSRFSLSSVFRRAAVYTSAVGVWLSGAVTTPAHGHGQQTSFPDQHHTVLTTDQTDDLSDACSYTDVQKDITSDDRADILALRADFAKTPLGQSMLDFADTAGIHILRSAELDAQDNIGGQFYADKNEIYISRNGSRSAQLMSLAHEIRHAWQQEQVRYSTLLKIPLPVKQQWILTSFIEADAFSFSSYYMAERLSLGHKSDFTIEERLAPPADAAYYLFYAMKKDGFNINTYRTEGLMFHFERLPTYYPEKCLERLEKTLHAMDNSLTQGEAAFKQGHHGLAEVYVRQVSHHFTRRPTDKEFEKVLRILGGVSLDVSQPTAFTHMPYDTLLNDYAFLQVARETFVNTALIEKRDALIEKYNAIEERARALRHGLGLEELPVKKITFVRS